MSNVVNCTGGAFSGIMNPYTGVEMEVKMVIRQGAEPLFFAPDTYDTSSPQPSAKAAYDNWNRADGVYGLRSGQPMKCAYTGAVLGLAETDGSYSFTGGFNPTRLHSREDFLKYARMRDGVSTYTPAPAKVESPRETAPAPKFHETEITDAAMDAALELAGKKRGRKAVRHGGK